jgi:hypothetical protein
VDALHSCACGTIGTMMQLAMKSTRSCFLRFVGGTLLGRVGRPGVDRAASAREGDTLGAAHVCAKAPRAGDRAPPFPSQGAQARATCGPWLQKMTATDARGLQQTAFPRCRLID